ncbi:MAG TPA: hypothetical protein V6D47_19655 [Oscillatoriaceae cyanobacterium]
MATNFGKQSPLGKAGSGLRMEDIEAELAAQVGEEGAFSDEESAHELRFIEAADRDIEARVSFRWKRDSLAMVKKAAARVGVPYQTYMKVVLYERAIADLAEPGTQRA